MNEVQVIEEITADCVDIGDTISFVASYEDDGETVIENVILTVLDITDNVDEIVFYGTHFYTEENVERPAKPDQKIFVVRVE